MKGLPDTIIMKKGFKNATYKRLGRIAVLKNSSIIALEAADGKIELWNEAILSEKYGK